MKTSCSIWVPCLLLAQMLLPLLSPRWSAQSWCMQGCQKFLRPSQLHSVCLVMTTRMIMEEKTKIGATKSKKSGWRLAILFRWIIGLSPPNSLVPAFLHGEKPGYEVSPLPPPSFLSPSHFHVSFVNICSLSHRTLTSLSGTSSRLRSYSISGLNQYVFVFQLFAHFPCYR